MLTPETKRKIDNCRDTLVGKIPVPMSQIEQITLALTYKFMSDIDEENRELGGASFFEGDFEKYAWKNIMDKRNGAQERLNLYSEGLDSMSRNGNIPDLFRDIFRNAYLPFKDPTTLDRFLKQIDEFHYEHSEELGNAFEYLLSTAGSQGDAGQFRTPRHIIDFLVSVVEPTKDDTILDPACGTAGFLISAYKHILEQNGKNLSIEDKQKISKNISGYDISHDMVRLSLVNMYLHNFADPKIYEYDTLSSEERWHDDFDCILANPPFMTPKGGSQPHKRFSITSTKSEVLFVDYIMEHMKIHGKAGIIVPEGVIFQSGKAYKELRENMMKNNFLWAVVSLPGGVFQPYSGVKTSILFFDRQLAKKTDKILFVKVSADGFDLGAQRRSINKNDLPEAFEILKKYKEDIEKNNDIEIISSPIAHLVEKIKIAESDEYSLSGEKYRVTGILGQSNWDKVELGTVCDILNGFAFDSNRFNDQKKGTPLIRIRDVNSGFSGTYFDGDFDEKYIVNNGDFLIGMDGDFRANLWSNGRALLNQRVCKLHNFNGVLKGFVFYLIQKELNKIQDNTYAVTVKHLSSSQIQKIQIPLPPLDIQEQIVAELDGYQRIIDGARAVADNYKPTIKMDPEWEMAQLGEICDITSSKRIFQEEYVNSGVPFYRTKEIVELSKGKDISLELFISNDRYNEIKSKFEIPKKGDILISAVGTIGVSWIVSDHREFYFKDGNLLWIKQNSKIISVFLKIFLDSIFQGSISSMVNGGAYNALTVITLKSIKIPMPSLEVQQAIVNRIEKEQKLVEATKELIEIYEIKIKERIGEVWGENNPKLIVGTGNDSL